MSEVIPTPRDRVDVSMGDGATIRVRAYGRPDGIRVFVSNGNGFAVDGYYPFWGPLTDRFDVIALTSATMAQIRLRPPAGTATRTPR